MAHDPVARLRELGHELPEVPEPAGVYMPAVRAGPLIFTAGQLPFENGELPETGKVGGAVTLEKARDAAGAARSTPSSQPNRRPAASTT